MMKILFRMTFAIALVLVLTATGLWAGGADEEGPEAAADKKYVTDPVAGTVVSAPEYGGTLTQAIKFNLEPGDVWFGFRALGMTSGVVEKLAMVDWAIDRDTYPFLTGYIAPLYALTGALAESWEQPDDTTYVFHIRKGVHWHDKAPMNGRELTADDVEYNFHRLLGNKLTGTQFSEADPSPGGGRLIAFPFESVEATDKYTVVMKLKEPRLRALNLILDDWNAVIQPPEVIEQYGDMQDWRNIVGTGPYTITDFTKGSSITWTKNPNYWGYDEKYPENRLPYIDEITGLVIPEEATFLAGLRTAKIDFIGWPGATQLNEIETADRLKRTNPELVFHTWSERSNASFAMNTNKPPWDDIRVRQAMQMALDLETMNDGFYNGAADTIPRGIVALEFKGYHVPFEEWPEEIKRYHRYDPAGAERLLDEAGLPRGADGMRFKTTYMHFPQIEVSWAELVAEYWRDIGVAVDIETRSMAESNARRRAGDWEIAPQVLGIKADPSINMHLFWSGNPGNTGVSDPEYDALYDAAQVAATIEEQKALFRQMDWRIIEQFWSIWGPLAPAFSVHWPWVIGYNGEGGFGGMQNMVVFSRLWIDSELKNAMGY